MEKRYLVKWEIDTFAESELDAINEAIKAMPFEGNETLATVFDVEEINDEGKMVSKNQIDILEMEFIDGRWVYP